MQSKQGPQIIATGESFGQVWFPLALLLDVVDDCVGVGRSHIGHIVIELSKIPRQFQGEPLQVVNSFEAAELRDIGGVRCPTRVIRVHEPVMLLEEADQPMVLGKNGAIDREHREDASDGGIGSR